MLVWVGLNAFLLTARGATFDPYPYILINLFLSMLAAIQAPVILMSQNRQSEKDRLATEHDYEVNLKTELEIMSLHEKIDVLREEQWTGRRGSCSRITAAKRCRRTVGRSRCRATESSRRAAGRFASLLLDRVR